MFRVRCKIPKWLFPILLVISMNHSDAELETNTTDLNSFDFEEIKNGLFATDRIGEIERIGGIDFQNFECLKALGEIGYGLKSGELWAIKRKLDYYSVSIIVHEM